MKQILNLMAERSLRLVFLVLLSAFVAACGSSDATTDPGTIDPVSNPDSIDVNGDGFLDDVDDWNFDGVVDQADVDAYLIDNPPGQTGNIEPDCSVKDCDSNNAIWSDNAIIAQNRSPVSSYAVAIQRITYCLNNGGAGSLDDFADGIYGGNSADAVKQYQTDNSLVSDGIVGPATWESLQGKLDGPYDFDSEFDAFFIPSLRPDCENKIMFYQQRNAPNGWRLATNPGEGLRSPMSVDPF